MGSRLDIENAYIAGFLDGDGSLMLQIKRRKDCKSGYRFMATICFYQDSCHDKHLYWIKELLGIGYISKRSDNMTELRINGFSTVYSILYDLSPYIKFKEIQTKIMMEACQLLKHGIRTISKENILKLVDIVLEIQKNNYKSSQRKTKEGILKIINLTP